MVVHKSLGIFTDRIRRLTSLIQPVISALGLEFRTTVPEHVLHQLLPVAKTEWVRDQMAISYGIPVDAIDEERLKRKQDTLLGEAPKETGAEMESEQKQKRAKKNDAEKMKTAVMKGQGREDPSK